jgi:hypothetical protein
MGSSRGEDWWCVADVAIERGVAIVLRRVRGLMAILTRESKCHSSFLRSSLLPSRGRERWDLWLCWSPGKMSEVAGGLWPEAFNTARNFSSTAVTASGAAGGW